MLSFRFISFKITIDADLIVAGINYLEMVTVLSSIKITFISREETIEREGEGESEDFRDRSFSMPGIREE